MRHLYTLCLALVLSCTNEGAATQTLLDSGYTDITITGFDYFTCADSDQTCTGFEARGPTGRYTQGAVGCNATGCGKGCTIRLK